jgi:hypothetical protein
LYNEIVSADEAIAELKVHQQQRKDDLSKLKNQIIDLKNASCTRIGQPLGRGNVSSQQDLRHELDIEDGEFDLGSGEDGANSQPPLRRKTSPRNSIVLAGSNKSSDQSALDRHRHTSSQERSEQVSLRDSSKGVEVKSKLAKKSKNLAREVPTQSPQSIGKRNKSSKKRTQANSGQSLDDYYNKPIVSEKLTSRYEGSHDVAESCSALALPNLSMRERVTNEKVLESSLLKDIKERLGIESDVDNDCDLSEIHPGETKHLHHLQH